MKNNCKTKNEKLINIKYNQGYILHQSKASEEFIDTVVKSLKMSKSTIIFEINYINY